MNLRWINGALISDEEWTRGTEKIEEILAARGWASLNKDMSRVLVAEDDGELKGFFVLQMFPHTEPLWIAPSMRGTTLASDLANTMLEFLNSVRARGWMLIAENHLVERMVIERGMKKLEYPVYIQE